MVRFGQADLVLYLSYDFVLTRSTSSLPTLLFALSSSPSQELFPYSFTIPMFTRILTAVPRTVIVRRTLATLPSASTSVTSTGPRLSTTNTAAVLTVHHDSPQSPQSTTHHASYS